MDSLRNEYPVVQFVLMTGHLDGTGEQGQLHQRNERIRTYAQTNNLWLFDFADIDSHDSDGVVQAVSSVNRDADTISLNVREISKGIQDVAQHATELGKSSQSTASVPLVQKMLLRAYRAFPRSCRIWWVALKSS